MGTLPSRPYRSLNYNKTISLKDVNVNSLVFYQDYYIATDPFYGYLRWFDQGEFHLLRSLREQVHIPMDLSIQPFTDHLVVCNQTFHDELKFFSLEDPLRPKLLYSCENHKKPDGEHQFDCYTQVCFHPNGSFSALRMLTSQLHTFDSRGRILSIVARDPKDDSSLFIPYGMCTISPAFCPSTLGSGLICVADKGNFCLSFFSINLLSSASVKQSLFPAHLFSIPTTEKPLYVCMDLNGYLHVSFDTKLEIFDPRKFFSSSKSHFSSQPVAEPLQTLEMFQPRKMCVDDHNVLTLFHGHVKDNHVSFLDCSYKV